MKLPKIISALVAAQDNFDSSAFASCFSETAIVFDEAKTHTGQKAIKKWNEKTNEEYKTRLRPIAFSEDGKVSILTTKVIGTFEGSPITLKYNFELKDGLIEHLKITS
jgi:ketosteroid isomerase-like protein